MIYDYKAEEKTREQLPVYQWSVYLKEKRDEGWSFHNVLLIQDRETIKYIFMFRKRLKKKYV